MNEKRCLVIDGNNLIYRCYFASQKLPWKDEVGAIFIFLRTIIKLVKKNEYHKLFFAFDEGKVNFRNSLSNDYKSNRKETPNDLISQIKILQELLSATNITYLKLKNFEADDLIASFVDKKNVSCDNIKFTIFSQDKDLLQLLSPEINIIKYLKKKIVVYNNNDFINEYNFSPFFFIDYLSLLGDVADNIKGVEKIGSKKAQQLINKFGKVEKLYENIDKIPDNLKKTLIENKEIVFRNKQIISLRRDIDLSSELSNCDFNWENWKKTSELYNFCHFYQFKSILKLLI